jgi:hypothetical protein
MKKQLFFFFALFTGVIFMIFSGCMKKQNFSDIPQISYTGMELLVDTAGVVRTGILTISYQDGNGDIGLSAADTFSPYQKGGQYYYNYVINYFEKQNGIFQQVDLTIPFSLRIPVLTPNDPNKPIQGYIADSIGLYPPPRHDPSTGEAYN